MPYGLDSCGHQNNLIARVAAVQKNTVVVLHTGSPVECPWANDVNAVLCMYLGGEGVAIYAAAQVISAIHDLNESFGKQHPDAGKYIVGTGTILSLIHI